MAHMETQKTNPMGMPLTDALAAAKAPAKTKTAPGPMPAAASGVLCRHLRACGEIRH